MHHFVFLSKEHNYILCVQSKSSLCVQSKSSLCVQSNYIKIKKMKKKRELIELFQRLKALIKHSNNSDFVATLSIRLLQNKRFSGTFAKNLGRSVEKQQEASS